MPKKKMQTGVKNRKRSNIFKRSQNIKFSLCRNVFAWFIGEGLLHDLSKYGWTNFSRMQVLSGTRSPNNAERKTKVFFLLHGFIIKKRNKHHYEYWLDYDSRRRKLVGMKMPVRLRRRDVYGSDRGM